MSVKAKVDMEHSVGGLEKVFSMERKDGNVHLSITTTFVETDPIKGAFTEACRESYIGVKTEIIIPEAELKQEITAEQGSTIPSLKIINSFTTPVAANTSNKTKEEIISEGEAIQTDLRNKLGSS